MTANNGVLPPAVLTVVSVASLSLLSLMCLRCRRKPKTIHEEPQIYNPQTFQRGGSRFAVMRSKTVTRAFPTASTTVETLDEIGFPHGVSSARTVSSSPDDNYIAPIEGPVYENDKPAVESPGVYGNIFPPLPTAEDDDDYENSQFLDHVMKEQEDNEPDYVNQDVDGT